MSLSGILGTARSALTAHQTAIQITSNNVANAQTVGYTRQRAELAASPNMLTARGVLGGGANVLTVTRTRDSLLDATFRSDDGDASASRTAAETLEQLDGVFGEPSETGLAATIDAFWSAWDDLAGDPTSLATRSVVRERGAQLAATFNTISARIDTLVDHSRARLGAEVAEVNQLTAEIAELNPRIVGAESSGHSANDLRDLRDLKLDRLAQLSGATSVERSDGSTGVFIGGRLVVDRETAHTVVLGGGSAPTFGINSLSQSVSIGGRLGALRDVVAGDIPRVVGQVDALASAIVGQVNAVHSTGVTFRPGATPAGNFFDVTTPAPAGGDPLRTARGIRLAATLATPADVAAAGAGATGIGNNASAAALAGLRTATATFTSADGSETYATTTFGDFYRRTIADLGLVTRGALDSASAREALASNSEARRASVTDVSSDEELVTLIKHQQAYAAAARVISAVEEMTRTLIDLGR